MTTTRFDELVEKHLRGQTTEREAAELWKLAKRAGFKFDGRTPHIQHADGRRLEWRHK